MLKDEILDYCQRDYVSFAELDKHFPELFGGNEVLIWPGCPNLIVWQGFSKEGADIIVDLLNSKKLYLYPSRPFVYALDGKLLKLPVAKRIWNYKREHWLPMVLCPKPPEYYAKKEEAKKQAAKKKVPQKRA